MRSRNVESQQLGAWLFTGMTAPLAQFAGKTGWQTVVLAVFACLAVSWLLGRTTRITGRWISILEILWLVIVLAVVGRWICGSWPSGNVFPAVPLTLLALGAFSASRGRETAARAGSTVFWLVALVFSIVAAAGLGEVGLESLGDIDSGFDPRLAVISLTPALTVFLPGEGSEVPLKVVAAVWGFAVLMTVLVTGALSLPVAVGLDMPLYEWVKGLRIAGTLQRFEALVSVALTMGWFALVSFVLHIGGELAENLKAGGKIGGVWSIAAASGLIMVSRTQMGAGTVLYGCVLLWIAVPGVAVFVRKNKIEKSKNNA